jgi:hypothetical protein
MLRAYPIKPMIGCDKVASGIAHHGNIEFFEGVDDIFAKSVFV